MKHHVTLLPGEGIGPEVSAATQRVIDASGVNIEWEILGARAENTDKATIGAEVLNAAAIESVRRNRVALKGPMATAIAGGARSVNVALRKSLDLYANGGGPIEVSTDLLLEDFTTARQQPEPAAPAKSNFWWPF